MDNKLTLNVDRTIVEQAKAYAKKHKVSLSKLIESYLTSLVNQKPSEVEITPLVQSLSGVINLDEDTDIKKAYTDYLIEKYK